MPAAIDAKRFAPLEPTSRTVDVEQFSGKVEIRCYPAFHGFEIDLAWDGGKLTSVKIKSVGGPKATLRYGSQTAEIELKPGHEVHLNPGLQRVR